jgi:hypothetical protein
LEDARGTLWCDACFPVRMLTGIRAALPLDDARVGLKFVGDVVQFLRHPITLTEAHATIRQRLAERESDFLHLARRAIYGLPNSAYLELLRLIGCEFGDLERLVRQEGLEQALQSLYRQGVYLTVDELKGREPAVRGSASVAVEPSRVLNPLASMQVMMQTSGSRGPRMVIPLNLAAIRASVLFGTLTTARPNLVYATWQVPGGAALYSLLAHAVSSAPSERWFSQVHPSASGLHPRYRWSGRAIQVAGFLAGIRIPAPEYVPVDAPLPIAEWLAEQLRRGKTPVIDAFASSASILCQKALAAGIDLEGAQFVLGGEPLTEALLETVRRVGADAAAGYGSMESGTVAFTCEDRVAPDDMHLLTDLHAVIQPGLEGRQSHLPANALLATSLRDTAPFILLNTSMGDVAEMGDRSCGCTFEQAGWATHLHTIRSFEKLTAAGMTFLDRDVIHVLEEALPARFGGGPTDYQLVEEAATDGPARLCLLVHPAVGPLDANEVADAFLTLIGDGSGAERVMELQWRQSGVLRVERRPPLQTASGKIHHLHLDRGVAVHA